MTTRQPDALSNRAFAVIAALFLLLALVVAARGATAETPKSPVSSWDETATAANG